MEETLRFADASAEARRLEKKAIAKSKAEFDKKLFDEFDVTSISLKSFEEAIESARRIEGAYFEPPKVEKQAERKEVLVRSREEIGAEEKKIEKMKEKFAKISEGKEETKRTIITEAREIAKKPERKVGRLGEEEIKGVSEEFSAVTMRKEEREKRERIKKMKKEIEDMLKEED